MMPRKRGRSNKIIRQGRGQLTVDISLPSQPQIDDRPLASPPPIENPPHPSQPHTDYVSPPPSPPPSQDSPHPSATSSRQLGGDPIVVPSSVDSRIENNVARRNLLTVVPTFDPKRFNDRKVNREIVSNVIIRMPTPAVVWKDYNEKMKEDLLAMFMRDHDFASDYDRRNAPKVWETICAERYSDQLAKLRKSVFDKINSNNIADLMGRAPPSMREEVWDDMVAVWKTDKWQKKSVACKSNLASNPECNVHTAGSKSFREHYEDLEKELKTPVDYQLIYEKLHKRKDGEYVSEKAKQIAENYHNKVTEKYGDDTSVHSRVDSNILKDVARSSKKGRVHGIGSLDLMHDSTQASSSPTVLGPSHSRPLITEDLIAAISSVVQSQLSTMQAQMQQQLQSTLSSFFQTFSQTHQMRGPSQQNQDNEDVDRDNLD